MTTAAASAALPAAGLDDLTYRRRIWAWTMYDWANSAFATTILGAVLPVYYSTVAGATLPSKATATAYWSLGLSISLFITALLSPILGTISDVARGKKRFLAVFAGLGIVGTALLVLVGTGDWMLASVLAVLGRIGFNGSISFYDSLLPHVAKEADQDRVSTRGYAMGYLGGGLLLAVNIVMIQLLPGTWGARLSFFSVAIWWAVFSIPLFRQIPEPPAAGARLIGENVVSASFKRLWATLKDIRRYGELFKFLVAFLIYNDAIGTIIGVAVIYGAELGLGDVELILALLLVQFVGIPFSLIFGRLPSRAEARRPLFLAFIVFNLVALPLGGVLGRALLPGEITGGPLPSYEATDSAAGEGVYPVDGGAIAFEGAWETIPVPASELRVGGLIGFLNGELTQNEQPVPYASASEPGARYDFAFNGQKIAVTYSTGPDRGLWEVQIDGQPVIDEDTGQPLRLDAYNSTIRYGERHTFTAAAPGEHVLSIISTGEHSADSTGTAITLAQVEVLPPIRQNNLLAVIGLILVVEVLGILFALALGRPLFTRLADLLDTKRSIILALILYSVIAVWGYFIDSLVEFWFLAWMVAIVQGGSQALSRSLYAGLSPAAKSGEFFGLFGVMEKFSSLIGPLLFAIAGATFGSSRPAILSLIAFFLIGMLLLTRVNVAEGRRVAQAEDAALLGAERAA